MGESKIRKELGIPLEEKLLDLKMPNIKNIYKEKVSSSLFQDLIIPYSLYAAIMLTFIGILIYLAKSYKLIN